MNKNRTNLRMTGGALAVLLALAVLATLSLFGGHPQPTALAEPGQAPGTFKAISVAQIKRSALIGGIVLKTHSATILGPARMCDPTM